MSHIIVDKVSRIVLNSIAWDGVVPFTPPMGADVVPYDGPVYIGGMWDGTYCSNPNPPKVTNPAPSAPSGMKTL